MNLLPAARLLLAVPFVVDGVDALLRPDDHVARVQRAYEPLAGVGLPGPPDDLLRPGSRAMGTVSAVAGLGLAVGIAPRACALVLAGLNMPVTLANAPVWLAADAEERARHVSALARGAALGAGLALAVGGHLRTR
ncbi:MULTISPECIES: DoxX family membrane protein [Actinomyces]|uniref:DoxX family membrane protein n=1 Tax=Actinomyces respiraculi TaxID=2744574 RepID=A0A7T0PXR2_9ACTO|nr:MULTISPECIES: DoxX family membrane protein [Actinomyces]QPL05890.1 DoxX family membrane protein [Actinomyces respiraculi]